MRNHVAALTVVAGTLLTPALARAQPIDGPVAERIKFLTIHGRVDLLDSCRRLRWRSPNGVSIGRDLLPGERTELLLALSFALDHTNPEESGLFVTLANRAGELPLDMGSPYVKPLIQRLVKLRDSLRKRYGPRLEADEVFLVSRENHPGPGRGIAVEPGKERVRRFYFHSETLHWELSSTELTPDERQRVESAASSWRNGHSVATPDPSIIPAHPSGGLMQLDVFSGPRSYRYVGANLPGALPSGGKGLAAELAEVMERVWVYRTQVLIGVVEDAGIRCGDLLVQIPMIVAPAFAGLKGEEIAFLALVKNDRTWGQAIELRGRLADLEALSGPALDRSAGGILAGLRKKAADPAAKRKVVVLGELADGRQATAVEALGAKGTTFWKKLVEGGEEYDSNIHGPIHSGKN